MTTSSDSDRIARWALSNKILSLSLGLVKAETDPDQAVEKIRLLSRGDLNALRLAQRGTSGFDEYLADGALRLLTAALNNSPVESPSSADAPFFDEQRRLNAMPLQQAFEELVSREPRLGELAADLGEGGPLRGAAYEGRNPLFRWFYRQAHLAVDAVDPSTLPGLADPSLHIMINVKAGLKGLVGPAANSDDRMIKSRMAERLAMSHLARVAGWKPPDGEGRTEN